MSRMQLARVVVELQGPVALGAGGVDDVLDAPIVLDADGLPALPGSSVGGVLRSIASENHPEDTVDGWFGNVKGDAGTPSLVWVSWGRPHGADDIPVAPRLLGGAHDDPVLDAIRGTVVRDHVRLNSHGAVADRGKFDRSFVPGGVRFTLELRVDEGGPPMDRLIGWLHQASVGGSTRAGFGRLRVVRATFGTFDLSTQQGRVDFGAVPRALWKPAHLATPWGESASATESRRRSFHLTLRPEQGLLIGGRASDPEGVDLTWFREHRIVWKGGVGTVRERDVLPGTALKGAVRHRALFHLHLLCERQAEVSRLHSFLFGTDPNTRAEGQGESPEEIELEGGRVRVDEVLLPEGGRAHRQMHVALDRFTMGPRDGMLFEEEALWLEGLPLEVSIDLSPREGDSDDDLALAQRALERTLDDLCEGRLGLGHGNSRGHGFFQGTRRQA